MEEREAGCGLNSDGTQSESLLYASWHNNLNFELANFNRGLELITSCTEKEVNGVNLSNLYFAIEMFTDTNDLFILRGLKNAENIPEGLGNKLISPEILPHLDYVFETVNTLKEINKKI
ncbi:hypothetical protein [Neomoorella mulderi]|uniref:Uncharacterized protein n=1 Tax=Moorella mulderi DSM 14980 TaxID=1122241 RepID=A0A151B1Y9_9FIRM|nr:hypothetical protein [Moorella mulderi]KYH33803.1 hypothetical protein MOMUL_05190 [Moorella mulderi DSM 14980]